jgi:hypothetical protein
MKRTKLLTVLAVVGCLPLFMTNATGQDLSFGEGLVLSAETLTGADPGGTASKGKLVYLTKTPAGGLDGRLVTVYADANHTGEVWEPKGLRHVPRDIFLRFSDDEGVQWSDPVNLSGTAQHFSAQTDWDGDGVTEKYWGDSGKPNVFSSGSTIVVSWVDRYCPEMDWVWGTDGQSTIQGRVTYPDIDVPVMLREIPYCGVYVAVSTDGGETWIHGADQPPLQLTAGRRDAIQDAHKGSGKRWVITWQEDPLGLQPGEADGPGEGASGAKTTQGTDIWYAYTEDITTASEDLRLNRTPLTNNSSYDVTGLNGFPEVQLGKENRGASRANVFLANDNGVFTAIVAYEETKGIPDILEGKTVQYHAFPFSTPAQFGPDTDRFGEPGVTLTGQLMNSRRVRFVAQSPDGVKPALAIFWKEGRTTEGGPSDIMLKLSTSFDPVDVAAAPVLNMSTETPTADELTLLDGPEVNPIEDARAHRAVLRGDMLVIGYSYTWNGPLARYTDMANYDFWVRRSLDGGQTWLAPQNLSALPTTLENVKEPRLVAPPKTGTQDDAVFLAAWGTETNVYEGLALPEPLDILVTRTFDQGATFDPVVPLAVTAAGEYESQLRITPDGSKIAAVWMAEDFGKEAMFGWSSPWQDMGYALAGTFGDIELLGVGPLTPGSELTLTATKSRPWAWIDLFIATEITPRPFKGGVVVALPVVIVVQTTMGPVGIYEETFQWPALAFPGDALTLQGLVFDLGAPQGIALTNALRATTR